MGEQPGYSIERSSDEEEDRVGDGDMCGSIDLTIPVRISPTHDMEGKRNAYPLSKKIRLGLCCMDVKATSSSMKALLSRINAYNDFEIVHFGNDVLLTRDVNEWPQCDCLIGFASGEFPLEKAIEYAKRHPDMMVLNDLPMQQTIQSRLSVYQLLEKLNVRIPPYVAVLRGADLAEGETCDFVEETDYIVVNGVKMEKPFLEKPLCGDDHNIYLYYHSSTGGGVRRLFRKVGNQASDFLPNVSSVRRDGSYIYEKFLKCKNTQRDIKVYTIGVDYCHAESRTSPTTGEKVKRTAHGREKRFAVRLTAQEHTYAAQIVQATGQIICGIDMLRAEDGQTYVFDINGWSSVKSKSDYHQRCGRFLR